MRRIACVALVGGMVAAMASGCGGETATDGAALPRFVRGGLVYGTKFEARAWSPGDRIDGAVAPVQPECAPLFHVELEDMDRLAALNAPAPGAALAFSPDGTSLAIGSDAGSLRIVDAWTGEERVGRRIAEGAVKRVAWSADSRTLYVGEQSPDATLAALDPATLAPRWSVRLADELETSPMPPSDDVYGLYGLPGTFAITVLPDGDLLVTGAHGWTPADGVRRNRSRVWRFRPDGTRVAAWPADGPADAVLLHPAVGGDRVLLGVSRSADGPAPADLPVGGVITLDATTLTRVWDARFPVLAPHFREVFLWEAAGLDDRLAFAGLGDGRAFLLDPSTGARRDTLTPGTPVLAQGVPIAAGVGFGAVRDGVAYFLTTVTNIPWGSADPMARPPAVHPAEHTLHAVAADGTPRWSRHMEHALQGVVPSPGGDLLAVAAAERTTDTRTDLYGALLFDAGSGDVVTTCSTEGPAFFRPVWSTDGRLAVAEAPYLIEGAVRGAYRVTVFR